VGSGVGAVSIFFFGQKVEKVRTVRLCKKADIEKNYEAGMHKSLRENKI